MFEQIGIDIACLHVFLIKMPKTNTASEAYLELFQTHMLELFANIVIGLRKAPS